jgi:hypothetical protein
MICEYVNWPGKRVEMTKEEFEALGKRKKLFKIVDEQDSDLIKKQILGNKIGLQPGADKKEKKSVEKK